MKFEEDVGKKEKERRGKKRKGKRRKVLRRKENEGQGRVRVG